MDVEQLKAIASLWKLVLAFAVSMGLVLLATVYREQSRLFLQRLARFKVKRGSTELSVNHDDELTSNDARGSAKALGRDQKAGPPAAIVTPEDAPKLQEPKPEGLEMEPSFGMWMALYDGRMDDAKVLFEKVQAAEKDPEQRLKTEASYLAFRFEKGDAGAQKQLQLLEEKAKQYPSALAAIKRADAECYVFADSHDSAVSIFEEAARISPTDLDRASNLASAADARMKIGQSSEGRALILDALTSINSRDAQAVLYDKLASMYAKANDTQSQALMLEKVAGCRVNSKEAHFNAAYAYANAGDNRLAAWHYSKALEIDAKYGMALNNLGVCFTQLKAPALAFGVYRKAADLGETLAAANLANILMDAGATHEADEVLAKARETKDYHKNVNNALVRLQTIRTESLQLRDQIIEAGNVARQWLAKLLPAAIGATEHTVPAASWTGRGVSLVEVDPSKGSRKVEIVYKTTAPAEKYRLIATMNGFVGRGPITLFKRDYWPPQPKPGEPEKGSWEDYGEGYVQVIDNGRTLKMLMLSNDNKDTRELTFRVEERPDAAEAKPS